MISAIRSEIQATDEEVGAAELYHHENVLRTSLAAAAPPWLVAFTDTLERIEESQIRIEDEFRTSQDELRKGQKSISAVLENMRITNSNLKLSRDKGSAILNSKQKEVNCRLVLVNRYNAY